MQAAEHRPHPLPDHAQQARLGSTCTASERVGIRSSRPVTGTSALNRIPGFQTYLWPGRELGEAGGVPGFQTYPYRDLGHKGGWGSGTGIRGTHLPGFETRNSRDFGHTTTGIWDTVSWAGTGNRGTNALGKHASSLSFSGRNLDLSNLEITNSTRGAGRFGGRGEG